MNIARSGEVSCNRAAISRGGWVGFHLAAIWRRDIYWKFIMNKISANFSNFGFPQKDYIFSTRLKILIITKFQFRYVNLYQNWRRGNSGKFNIYFLSRDSARFRFVNMIIIILKNAFVFARAFRINFWKWISVLDFGFSNSYIIFALCLLHSNCDNVYNIHYDDYSVWL